MNGISDTTCSCGSWLEHWKKFSGQPVTICPVGNCYNTDLVGAHVKLSGGYDSNWYILPLCNAHNQSGDEVNVPDAYKLVSANKSETCEKPRERQFTSF
jgi:hypothetical protein